MVWAEIEGTGEGDGIVPSTLAPKLVLGSYRAAVQQDGTLTDWLSLFDRISGVGEHGTIPTKEMFLTCDEETNTFTIPDLNITKAQWLAADRVAKEKNEQVVKKMKEAEEGG